MFLWVLHFYFLTEGSASSLHSLIKASLNYPALMEVRDDQAGWPRLYTSGACGPEHPQEWDADAEPNRERRSILKPVRWPFPSRATCPVPLLTDRLVASVKNAKVIKKCSVPDLKDCPQGQRNCSYFVKVSTTRIPRPFFKNVGQEWLLKLLLSNEGFSPLLSPMEGQVSWQQHVSSLAESREEAGSPILLVPSTFF